MSEPAEGALSPQAKLAATALAEIQKAIRFFRLYPATHRFCVRGVDEAVVRLRRYHEKFADLSVEVARDGLYLDDGNVLPTSGQSTDLPVILYGAGVFGLTLRRGVSERELADFIDVLSDSYSHAEEDGAGGFGAARDVLSALWQRDFSGIGFVIQDQLAPGSKKLDPEIADLADRIHELMFVLRGDDVLEGQEYEDRAGDIEVERFVARLWEERVPEARADPEQAHAYQRTAAGQKRLELLSELRDAKVEAPAERAARIVAWADGQGVTRRIPAEVVARFRAVAALHALTHHDLEGATEMVRQLVGEEGRLSEALSRRLGSVKALHGVAEALRREMARRGPEGLIDFGLAYLDLLHPSASAAAVEVYPLIGHADVRRVFRRYLSRTVVEAAEAIEPLTTHESEDIVKEGLGILAMAGKGTRAFELLERYARERDTLRGPLAKIAVEKLSGSRKSHRLQEIVLTDPNRDRRVQAARRLAQVGHPSSYEPLADFCRSRELWQRDDEEVLAIFKALRTCGGPRASAVFAELSELKKGLFGGKARERIGKLARMWIASERNQRRSQRRPRGTR
ncbi:MAG: hypothetical protein D6731_24865 [Planctomycetota bacterium]|nr:MAG: hypothetical protein D6731_24865 [Planctomycetota bacterium]